MEDFKTTNCCIGAHFDLEIPEVNTLKQDFEIHYGSIYNIKSHLTLILLPIPEDNITDAFDFTIDYLRGLNPINIQLESVHFDPSSRFFAYNINSNSLIQTHEYLLKNLQDSRSGFIREKDVKRIVDKYYSSSEIHNIYNNGFALSGNNYFPHISIGDVSKDNESKLIVASKDCHELLESLKDKTYYSNSITVSAYLDNNVQGQAKELRKETIELV